MTDNDDITGKPSDEETSVQEKDTDSDSSLTGNGIDFVRTESDNRETVSKEKKPEKKKHWLLILIIVLLILLLGAAVLAYYYFALYGIDDSYYDYEKLNEPVAKEEIYALSPVDEEGAKRIASLGKVSPDETWTICVYMVGSDLEDLYISELSDLMQYQSGMRSQELSAESSEAEYERFTRFGSELSANGLGIPDYLYHPVKYMPGSDYEEYYDYEDEYREEIGPGAGSEDIREMMNGVTSDKVKVIVQTGGARRWSNSMINPNRTQRFLVSSKGFEELENLPPEESFASSTVEGFLRYCDENFRSDRRMLVFWDHGSGPFGFGSDSIYGQSMRMRDIRQALAAVYTETPSEPPFDVIGFDACLMANLDVIHYLRGYADYLALSEESEPGSGWDFDALFSSIGDDPSMGPAGVARTVCDTYMDYYMTQNVNSGETIQLNNVTFSVIDAAKGEKLYEAYSDLAKKQLTDAVSDLSVLSEIGRCAGKSTHYADAYYNIFNLVDLGNYVDYMVDSYPEECSRIKKLIKETVLYHRENGNVSDSNGVSIYVPGSFSDYYGFRSYLDYIYEACGDDNIRALYYYQIAGCLNDELAEYTRKLTGKTPQILDTAPFREFSHIDPVAEEYGFSIPGFEKLEGMITGCALELGAYDEELEKITYYGNDDFVYPDGEGSLICEYDGSWVFLDGVPLGIEITSNTLSAVEYRSRILYDGEPAYLVFTYDRDRDDFRINGIRRLSVDSSSGDEYVADLKKKERFRIGSTITPVYDTLDVNLNEITCEEGVSVEVKKETRITQEPLPEGYYICDAVISNQRGERSYSKVMGIDIGSKGIRNIVPDSRFYGRDY